MKENSVQTKEIAIRTKKVWLSWAVEFLGLALLFNTILLSKSGDLSSQDQSQFMILGSAVVCLVLISNIFRPFYEILSFSEKNIKTKDYFIFRPPVRYEIHITDILSLEIQCEVYVKGYSSLCIKEKNSQKIKWTLSCKNAVLKQFVTEMLERVRSDSTMNTLPFRVIDRHRLLER